MVIIEICTKNDFKDPLGEQTLFSILESKIIDIKSVKYSPIYKLFDNNKLTNREINIISSELLTDNITEEYFINENINKYDTSINNFKSLIEVWYKHGVTDTVAESVVKAIDDLGIKKEIKVMRGDKYYLYGKISYSKLEYIATKLLVNTLIQDYKIII
ncbi:MAG: phosphoribosylformylglycinamidine synthase subunit PurS [Endomicrobium sp.]|jgi:phosphoribosylformylglycinamidine synthase|nr:phosphoribosylformylglycinamidine synthase subunit PurS [Endomicrobium sp.]